MAATTLATARFPRHQVLVSLNNTCIATAVAVAVATNSDMASFQFHGVKQKTQDG